MAPTTHIVPNATEMSSGHCQLAKALLASVGELSAAKDPSRAIVRLIPKAKLSSLPRNHRAMAVVTATISDSAPSPNSRRPATITARVLDSTPSPSTELRALTPAPSGASAGVFGHAV